MYDYYSSPLEAECSTNVSEYRSDIDMPCGMLYKESADFKSSDAKTSERMKQMSFAGIIFSGSHILGFADSQPSIVSGDRLYKDPSRDKATKIFSTDHCIAVFTGGSNFKIVENGRLIDYYLDAWLSDHISDFQNPKDLCYGLFSFIHDKVESEFGAIDITCGSSENGYACSTVCTIKRNYFNLEEAQIKNFTVLTSGNTVFTEYCKANPDILNVADEDILKKNLHTLFAKIDFGHNYNPVGEPWIVKNIDIC